MRVGPESITMGMRGIMQNIIYFDDVLVTEANLLGEVNKGMDVAEEAMIVAHLCMGAVSIGGMKRCAQLMFRYAERRQVSTGILLDNPTILALLSELTLKITLGENLVYRLAEVMDQDDYPPKEIGMMAKILTTDYLWKAADDLIQTLGGRGYMENNLAPQILRDARMLRIGEGANEIVTITIGRRILYSVELHQFLTENLGNPTISAQLKDAAQKIQDRCLALNEVFTNRSAALSWSYYLIGQVSILGVALAAAQSTNRNSPSESLKLAINWASSQFETTLNQAINGYPQESFLFDSSQLKSWINNYNQEIGNLEQRPPGCEDTLDPLLWKEENKYGFPDFSHLPGNINSERVTVKTDNISESAELSLEQKKALAKKLMAEKTSQPPS